MGSTSQDSRQHAERGRDATANCKLPRSGCKIWFSFLVPVREGNGVFRRRAAFLQSGTDICARERPAVARMDTGDFRLCLRADEGDTRCVSVGTYVDNIHTYIRCFEFRLELPEHRVVSLWLPRHTHFTGLQTIGMVWLLCRLWVHTDKAGGAPSTREVSVGYGHLRRANLSLQISSPPAADLSRQTDARKSC